MPWIETSHNGFVVRYRVAGGPKRAIYVPTEPEAKTLKAKIEYDLARGINPDTGQSIRMGVGITCAEAITRYREWSNRQGRAESTYTRDIQTIVPFLEECPSHLFYVTTEHINSFLCEKIFKTASSYNKSIAALRAFFRAMKELGYTSIDISSLKYRKTPRQLPTVFTDEQVAALIEALAPQHRPIAFFIAITGCRIGEAVNLKWRDVKLPNVLIKHPKEGHDKALVLPKDLSDMVAALPRTGKYVFERDGTDRTLIRNLQNRLKTAARKCEIDEKQVHWHKFRHTAASRLVLQLPVPVVQQLLGHQTITTTQKYIAVAGAHMAKAARGPLQKYARDLLGKVAGQAADKSSAKPQSTVAKNKGKPKRKRSK